MHNSLNAPKASTGPCTWSIILATYWPCMSLASVGSHCKCEQNKCNLVSGEVDGHGRTDARSRKRRSSGHLQKAISYVHKIYGQSAKKRYELETRVSSWFVTHSLPQRFGGKHTFCTTHWFAEENNMSTSDMLWVCWHVQPRFLRVLKWPHATCNVRVLQAGWDEIWFSNFGTIQFGLTTTTEGFHLAHKVSRLNLNAQFEFRVGVSRDWLHRFGSIMWLRWVMPWNVRKTWVI